MLIIYVSKYEITCFDTEKGARGGLFPVKYNFVNLVKSVKIHNLETFLIRIKFIFNS